MNSCVSVGKPGMTRHGMPNYNHHNKHDEGPSLTRPRKSPVEFSVHQNQWSDQLHEQRMCMRDSIFSSIPSWLHWTWYLDHFETLIKFAKTFTSHTVASELKDPI